MRQINELVDKGIRSIIMNLNAFEKLEQRLSVFRRDMKPNLFKKGVSLHIADFLSSTFLFNRVTHLDYPFGLIRCYITIHPPKKAFNFYLLS